MESVSACGPPDLPKTSANVRAIVNVQLLHSEVANLVSP